MKPKALMLAAFARQAGSIAAALVTVPIIAHGLGPDALGAWALLISAAMFMQLGDLGMANAVRRAVIAGREGHACRAIRRSRWALATVGAVLALVIPLLIGDLGSVRGGAEAAQPCNILGESRDTDPKILNITTMIFMHIVKQNA